MFPISPSHLYLIGCLVQSIVLSENFLDFWRKTSNLMIFWISHDSTDRNSNSTKIFLVKIFLCFIYWYLTLYKPITHCYIAQIWNKMHQFKILSQSTVLKVWRWMVDTETNLRTSRIKTEKHANFRLTINIWNTNFHCLSCANTKDYKPRQ